MSDQISQDLGKITPEAFRILQVNIREGDIGEFIPWLFFHHRLPDRFGLRKKTAGFFCVAVSGSGFCPGSTVNIFSDAFMDGCVFIDQIIVIFVVGVKVLECAVKEINGQLQVVISGMAPKGKPYGSEGNRDGVVAFADQVKKMQGFSAFLFCLSISLADKTKRVLQEVRIAENGENGRHSFQIILIVQNQKVVQTAVVCEEIFLVDGDQLSSGADIGAGDSKKVLDGFLLQALQPQKPSIRLDPAVDIHAFDSGKVVGETEMRTALLKIGNIKTVTIEMNQNSELIQERKKGMQEIFLGFRSVREPLPELPVAILIKGAANQVKMRMIAGESGGFNIKEEDFFSFPDPFQGIGIREGQGLIYGNHIQTPLILKDYAMIIAGKKQKVNKKQPALDTCTCYCDML